MSDEFELIARLGPHLAAGGGAVVVGPGDDAAVLAVPAGLVCLTVDVLVEGVHFDRALSSPPDIGWKAVAVNVSDLAAMGARPVAGVVGLVRPAAYPEDDVVALYAGAAEAGERWGLPLVGGDTVAGGELAVSLTAVGVVDGQPVRRAGARPGDRLVVVGAVGAAAAALALHAAGQDVPTALLDAHRRPRALPAAGEALRIRGATAMIDVSDGLGADAAHVCRASQVAAVVDLDALPLADGVTEAARRLGVDPLTLICGGEDFALLAAVPAEQAQAAAGAAAAAEGVPARVVGEVVAHRDPLVGLRGADGTVTDISALGYDHYPGNDPQEDRA